MTLQPTPEQEQALQSIARWYVDGAERPFVLAGLAGTGKTACLPLLADRIGKNNVRFVAPTWKAASVLTGRLRSAGLTGTRATSVHALLYRFVGIEHEEHCSAYTWEARQAGADCDAGCTAPSFMFEPDREEAKDLIVCDESSMVPADMRADIEALGHPVLYVGDPGQLAPVKGKSIFTERAPDFELQAIQRQVADSPIITLSRIVRSGDPHWLSKAQGLGFSTDVYDIKDGDFAGGGSVFLAYRNAEVDSINAKVRRVLGYDEGVVVGDRILIRDNMRNLQIYNGQTGVVRELRDEKTTVEMDSGQVVQVRLKIAPSALDGTEREHGVCRANYAYALTTHKAQGSEFREVIIKVPRRSPGPRWLYTAVTRCTESLILRP